MQWNLENLTFGESCVISLICMLVVFAVLCLLWGLLVLMNKITNVKANKKEVKSNNVYHSLEEIQDEDMMVAALVASIDYHNEIKKDVRVVSIKEL